MKISFIHPRVARERPKKDVGTAGSGAGIHYRVPLARGKAYEVGWSLDLLNGTTRPLSSARLRTGQRMYLSIVERSFWEEGQNHERS